MRHSTDRIRSTHGGNLPLPSDLGELIAHGDAGRGEVDARLSSAVAEVVRRQQDLGIDVVNDGEFVKAAHATQYSGYIHSRVTGWEWRPPDPSVAPKRAGVGARDRRDFPGFYESGLWLSGSGGPVRPGFAAPGRPPPEATTERVCTGPVTYIGQADIDEDVRALEEALVGADAEGFIAALGPLSLGAGARNEHYADEETYLMAVAEAVRLEYKAITDAGLIVQIDEPEFATGWNFHPDWTIERYRSYLGLAVDVINHALDGLPRELVRFHMCWGSGHRPHTNDVPLATIADLLIRIDAGAFAVEASNVRHAHEWQVWRDVKIPEGTLLVPGVVGHATDLVEHPELVAERLVNFAGIVGRENVQAGTDCGIGSRVGHPEIVWAKLKALADGAAIATDRLWG